MDREPERTIADKFREGTPIDHALVRAVREAIRMHKRLGYPIATMRDGQVVWIPAAEIPEPPVEE